MKKWPHSLEFKLNRDSILSTIYDLFDFSFFFVVFILSFNTCLQSLQLCCLPNLYRKNKKRKKEKEQYPADETSQVMTQ